MARTVYTPFLHRVFGKNIKATISEGWIYGADEAELYGGYINHQAVDFAVPMNTPVIAAADGLALASFEEVPIRYPGTKARYWHGEAAFWGHGLHVLILHPNNFISIYGHLQTLTPEIANVYLNPSVTQLGDTLSQLMRLTDTSAFLSRGAAHIKSGQQLGTTGVTGMGLGKPTYGQWLHNEPYKANDEPHLHFAISTLPAMSEYTNYIDPFNINGYAHEYPDYVESWAKIPGSLWLE